MPGHPELLPDIARVVNEIRAKWPRLTIESTYRPGGTSYHAQNRACDLGTHPFDQAYQDRAGAWVQANLTDRLVEGIHKPVSGPALSVKNYKQVDPLAVYGAETFQAHLNHIHVAA